MRRLLYCVAHTLTGRYISNLILRIGTFFCSFGIMCGFGVQVHIMIKHKLCFIPLIFASFYTHATDVLSCDYTEVSAATGAWENLESNYHVDYYLDATNDSAISIENNVKTKYEWHRVDESSVNGNFLISEPTFNKNTYFYTTTTVSSAHSGYTVSTTSSINVSTPITISYRGQCMMVK